ncbi:MAG: 2Fe-2S iron-sulfur cluster-binding protein, partial [Aeromicrobium sp.]
GWPDGSLHLERFAPKAQGTPLRSTPFEIELASTGDVMVVPPEVTVLEALEGAGVPVVSSCLEGTCGTCETVVLRGEVDHRDSLLTDAERAANDVMFVCCSRSVSDRLVLDA